MAVYVAMVVCTYVAATLHLAGLMLYLFRYVFSPSRAPSSREDAIDGGDPERQSSAGGTPGPIAAVPATLEWWDVSYRAKHHGRWRDILNGCSGRASPGHMTALMGPSGAGKSTLLDILAMRLQPSSGTVLLNGRPRNSSFRSLSAYVPQEAYFLPTLTVGETLMLHARLRLPRSHRDQYRTVIQDTLSSMGLSKAKHTQVGGELPGGLFLRGISGGEKRRLHIACGIVATPSIIFVDEPTSGLDSYAALVLMQHLKELAGGGRTVLCSIHQPRQQIWDMFSAVALLSEGFLTFFGHPSEAVPWFSEVHGMVYRAEICGASSDWLLDVVSVNYGNRAGFTKGFRSRDDVERAAALLPSRCPHLIKDAAAGAPPEPCAGLPVTSAMCVQEAGDAGRKGAEKPSYPTSFFNQFSVLCWRSLLQYLRNPADVALRLFVFTMLGTLLGVIFINTVIGGGWIDFIALFSLLNLLLWILLFHPMTLLTLFAADRRLFLVDLHSHIYGPCAWYLAQNLVLAPFLLFSSLVMLLLAYGLVGLAPTARAIGTLLASGCITSLIGHQIAVMAIQVMPNQDAAMLLTIVYNMFSLCLGGFFVRLSKLPSVLLWISYVTPMRYCFALASQEQLRETAYSKLLLTYDMTWSTGAYFGALIAILTVFCIINVSILVAVKAWKSMR